MKPESKKNWVPTRDAFSQFLNWLDEGVDSGGERYVEMRRRLAAYFDRRNCRSPDDLADETLNRVARRLEEEGTIADTLPARYCYIVAKFVFLESLRREKEERKKAAESPGVSTPRDDGDMDEPDREKLRESLERCLERLPAPDRGLILEYYRGERRAKIERRRDLAARLGVTINALSIRACRIRDKLESCVRSNAGEMFRPVSS
jgi:DNA-directed RNA polymerase specialized sigma24 family protein